ncbi:MAG: hypothetical protein ABIH72_04305 [archaeon]
MQEKFYDKCLEVISMERAIDRAARTGKPLERIFTEILNEEGSECLNKLYKSHNNYSFLGLTRRFVEKTLIYLIYVKNQYENQSKRKTS